MFSAVRRNVLWIPRYPLLYCSSKCYTRMGSGISCRWPRRSHIENCRKLKRNQTRKSVTVLVFSLHLSNLAQMWHSFNPWTYDVQGFCYRKRFESNGSITIQERAHRIAGEVGAKKGRKSTSAGCDKRGCQYWTASCWSLRLYRY
jgi:hypothetical protein